MTDYTKRLEEILQRAFAIGLAVGKLNAENEEYLPNAERVAVTSLIKELVAEAKPEKQNTENMGDTFVIWARGHNVATDRFEQNLLKALEEVNG